jgi:hypothetical protein
MFDPESESGAAPGGATQVNGADYNKAVSGND